MGSSHLGFVIALLLLLLLHCHSQLDETVLMVIINLIFSACAAPTATWRRLAWSWQALKVPVKCGDGDRGGNGDRGADGHGDDVGDFQPL